MHLSADTLVHSATDLSGYLACPHLTTLELARVRGGPGPLKYPDPGAEVLRQRGLEHEARITEQYRAAGIQVAAPAKLTWEEGAAGAWTGAASETLDLMGEGVDVIAQGCLFDGTWLGRPDFLVRVERPSRLGRWSYEVVDAKLARSATVGAVLQISAYSEMLEHVQGARPEHMHLALGGPDEPVERFRVDDFAAYYRSVKRRFERAVAERPRTYPEPCTHCEVCAWWPRCRDRWRADDHLSLVANITVRVWRGLEERGVGTLAGLAELPLRYQPPLDGVSDAAFAKAREQARIQLEGRLEGRHTYELFTDAQEGHGLLALPEPSAGDLFFDIEGDPHAYGEGIEYLLGWCDAEGRYTARWALTPADERAGFAAFIDFLTARLDAHPDLHVYHYAAYEQTALKRLAARYATREDEVDRLLRGGVLVDLYRVVRQGLRASVESYSIKKLEPLYGFGRDVDLRAASSALANFEAWLQLGGEGDAGGLLGEIEGYNQDDCVSTLRLRDWLEERRTELAGLLGAELARPEPPDPDAPESVHEESEEVRRLMAELTAGVPDDPERRTDAQQARWTLTHLLSWHRREKKSMWWQYFHYLGLTHEELLQDAKALAGLEYEGVMGKEKQSLVHRYRFPPQDFGLGRGDGSIDPETRNPAGKIVAVDEQARTIDLKRGERSEVPHPRALFPFEEIPDKVLKARLRGLAEEVVKGGLEGLSNRVAADLLLRRRPRAGQPEGESLRRPGEEILASARRLATALEGTVLPIQGPPGSGKTYVGARMIVRLLREGRRVGVTATSHKVIVNLLDEVCRAAGEEGIAFEGVQKAKAKQACRRPEIEHTDANKLVLDRLSEGEAQLGAGTVWLWARPEMREAVDVLFVDEAGQISLANVLAASHAGRSLVLLGDPQQLDQPQQGVHPPGTDVATLEHLVGGATLAPDRGLFLEQTWRLHPYVCAFTSELYYEGRLTSRPELSGQTVRGPEPFDGAGLRFVPVEHTGNSSESPEEVEAVRGLVTRLLGSGATWVNEKGETAPVTLEDVLIVAPYNAQVGALRAALPEGARVGTVDRFQGQEAAIVIYSMATSSPADAPRGMEFVYSPNRLNVATSRARCVAVLVASPELLVAECRSVRQMRLANGVCRFGEMAGVGLSLPVAEDGEQKVSAAPEEQ